ETIFDTLNAKAALYAIEEAFDDRGGRLPVMISGTITDASGRTLSGQTAGAFYASVAHGRPLSVGLNCALGAKDLRPHVETLATVADCWVSAHPNAGLPNAFGGYDETPEETAAVLRPVGWLRVGPWRRDLVPRIVADTRGYAEQLVQRGCRGLARRAPRWWPSPPLLLYPRASASIRGPNRFPASTRGPTGFPMND